MLRVSVAACAILAGCGLFGSQEGTTPSGDGSRLDTLEVAGARLVVLRRPTYGLAHLALWIDAGSRDGEPAQVATAAAWIAEARAGEGVQARVLPDGTSFETSCAPAALSGCFERLGRALAAREPTEEELPRVRARLEQARRTALADDARTADALALRALLGEAARGLAPFGEASGDSGVTRGSVGAFFAAHYGARRALIAVAGAVTVEAVVAAAEPVLEAAPPARADREARALRVARGTGTGAGTGAGAGDGARATGTGTGGGARAAGVVVEVGDTTVAAMAVALPDLAAAAGVGRALSEPDVAARVDGHEPVVHAFEVRGGALVVAHVRHDHLARAATELAVTGGRALVEGDGRAAPGLDDDPVAAARAVGMRFIAEGDAPAPPPAIALGAVVAGGRGDGAAGTGDPDAPVRRTAEAVLTRAQAAAHGLVRPETRGARSERAASVVTPNGARIDVRRRAGDSRVAVSVRFAGGAAGDPPAVHGRAALLAVLAAEACPALGPGGVDAVRAAIDATVAPRVDATSWGLVVEAPAARRDEALDLALRCALAVEPARADVERARILLLERLDGGPELAAWAARAIAPDAPGTIAPMGQLDAVRELSVASVRRAWRESTTGARIAVAVVGDVDVATGVARVARRVARLPRGTAAPSPPSAETPAPDGPLAADHPGAQPRVVVAWRAPVAFGPGPDATRERERRGFSGRVPSETDAGRVFGERVAAELGGVRGASVLWWDGGGDARGAWAAVGLDASEAVLADLPTLVASAIGRVTDEQLRAAAVHRAQSRARADASPAATADRVARTRLRGERRDGDAPRTWASLRAARPSYVIGRPR